MIKAANVLSPNPIPAATPLQNAIIFFNAPPNSTPLTSSDMYILMFSDINVFWIKFKTSWCLEATTKTVGIPIVTSSAWLGPDNTPTLAFGNSSNITSSSVFKLSFSNPFEQIITGLSSTYFLYCLKIFLVNFEGVTCKIKSLSITTSSKLV